MFCHARYFSLSIYSERTFHKLYSTGHFLSFICSRTHVVCFGCRCSKYRVVGLMLVIWHCTFLSVARDLRILNTTWVCLFRTNDLSSFNLKMNEKWYRSLIEWKIVKQFTIYRAFFWGWNVCINTRKHCDINVLIRDFSASTSIQYTKYNYANAEFSLWRYYHIGKINIQSI